RQVFAKYPGKIACVIMEAATAEEPQEGFLAGIKQICEKHGSIFILDEMITGFRWHLRGAQGVYDVVPHLSTFGKGMGNGFAIAALAGKKAIMQLGGLHHPGERVFLLSTTHGAETHALAASRETLHIYQRCGVIERLYQQGARLQAGILESISAHRVEG